jgi:hypothetical protein
MAYTGNDPFWVMVQLGVNAMGVGGSGVAKTSSGAAMAKTLNRWYHCFLPSQHLTEEVSGIPVVYREEGHVKMLPLDWVGMCCERNGLLCLDEVNTGTQSMLALLLGVLEGKQIGTLKLADDLMIAAFMNPPDLAPNALPIPASVRNRFFWWNWRTPVSDFLQGIENDDYPAPNCPVVENADMSMPKWGRLIRSFLEAKPEYIEAKSVTDEDISFPSLRTWRMTKIGCAGLDSIAAPAKQYLELVEGCVGREAASMFMEYVNSLGLYKAQDVLKGLIPVDYNDPQDRLMQLPAALVYHAKSMKEEGVLTGDMLSRGWDVMCTLGERGLIDCVKKPVAVLANVSRELWSPSSDESKRLGSLLRQIRTV